MDNGAHRHSLAGQKPSLLPDGIRDVRSSAVVPVFTHGRKCVKTTCTLVALSFAALPRILASSLLSDPTTAVASAEEICRGSVSESSTAPSLSRTKHPPPPPSAPGLCVEEGRTWVLMALLGPGTPGSPSRQYSPSSKARIVKYL